MICERNAESANTIGSRLVPHNPADPISTTRTIYLDWRLGRYDKHCLAFPVHYWCGETATARTVIDDKLIRPITIARAHAKPGLGSFTVT